MLALHSAGTSQIRLTNQESPDHSVDSLVAGEMQNVSLSPSTYSQDYMHEGSASAVMQHVLSTDFDQR